MHALIITFSRYGHLNPMLAVAQYLERAGHEVSLYSLGDDIAAEVARAGLRARTARVPTQVATPRVEAQRSVKLGERANNLPWAKRFAAMTLLDPVPAQVAALEEHARGCRPDVMLVDPLAYCGAIVAERLRVPWSCAITGLQSFTVGGRRAADASVFDELGPRRAGVMAALDADLAFRGCDVVAPSSNLLFAYEGLFPHGAPDGVTCVGPALPLAERGDARPFDWAAVPTDRPLVFVSFGSQLSHAPAIYQAVWDALSADEAVFVTTVTDLVGESFVHARPPHVIAVDYAPQLALLERARVMVTHGGANSVMESLSRGCPMLVIPIAYDQPLLAYLVETAGAGVELAVPDVTAERCRAKLLPLLVAESPSRLRASALAGGRGSGAERAAALLADLARDA